MTSPAQRHFNRMSAAAASAKASPIGSLAGSSAYELMLAKLYDDSRRLKEIQSIERKIEVKREILPEYDDWVSGALNGGRGGQDDVLVTVMVWFLDTGNYDDALRIAAYVIAHDLVLPDQYERNVATVVVDEISDAALRAQKDGKAFTLQILKEVDGLTSTIDMPDQARAKLHKALGAEYHRAKELVQAKDHYQVALRLNEKIGVKRLITELEAEIAKASA